MSDMRHRRYSGIIDVEKAQKTNIAVAGVGAVGMAFVMNAGKVGYRLTLYDPDKVTPVNLGIQWFRNDDVGKRKVHAAREIVQQFGCSRVSAIPSRFSIPRKRPDVVIIAVDDMDARAEIVEFLGTDKWPDLLIDMRMGAQVGQILPVVNAGEDRDNYMGTLHSNEDAEQERCTARGTMHCATGLASIAAGLLTTWMRGENIPQQVHVDFVNGKTYHLPREQMRRAA